jgi:NitT/TauT family transport system ATP-binding protein
VPTIGCTGIEKRFGDGSGAVDALEPVDLHLAEREVVALVGPSGCGKTTLLRVIAGLTPPTAGEARVGGRPVWEGGVADPEAVAPLAVVFQEAQLLPWMNVEDNIALPLRLRGEGKAARRAKAREMCELMEIGGFEAHRPEELSIGMRQRAAIGRALIAGPEVLLLDEPFAALDAITRDAMNLELQRVWLHRPLTALLVTHSIVEAAFLADRVVCLTSRPGRVAGETVVPFERPRSIDLQHTTGFQEVVRSIRSMLSAAA